MTEHDLLQRLSSIETQTSALLEADRDAKRHRAEAERHRIEADRESVKHNNQVIQRLTRLEADIETLKKLPAIARASEIGQAEDRASAKTRVEDGQSLRSWLMVILTTVSVGAGVGALIATAIINANG